MTTGTKLGASLAVALAVIAALGIGTYLSTQQFLETDREMVHTHQVIEKLENVLSVLKDAETGQRGFVLTGEEQYLEPYTAAIGMTRSEFDTLDKLMTDNPVQEKSLERVKALTADKLAELQETISLRRASGMDAALQVIRSGRGKMVMDDIRSAVTEMQDREQRLLDARESASKAGARRTLITVTIGTPLSLLVLAIFSMVVTGKTAGGSLRTRPGDRAGLWGAIALRYAFAAVATAVGTGLRLLLERSFGPLPAFVTLYPAVLLVASVAGGGPGVFASILAALAAAYYYLPPAGFRVDATNDILALTIFTGTNLLLCVLMGQLRKAEWAEAVSATQEDELDLLDRGTILALDPDHRIIRWSGGCRRLYGYKEGEAVGRTTHELFQMPVDQSLEEARRALLEHGYWQGERVRRAKDGAELTIAVLWALRRDEKGQPHSIMELSADITDRKRAEEALRESEARFATTLASIGDAVIATDLHRGISFMNPEAEKLTGWALQEAAGKPIGQVFHIINEHTRAEVESPVDKVLREGVVVGLANHTLLLRKDGTEVPIDDSGAPIKNADGGTTGVVLVFRDITERKQADEALRESEARFATTLASIGDAVIATDLECAVTFMNREAEALTGWALHEAAGKPIGQVFRIINEHTRAEVESPVDKVLREGVVVGLANHTLLIRKDGTEVPIDDSGAPIKNADGVTTGVVLVFRDITERKQAENAVRESEERLHFALSVSQTGAWDLDLVDHTAFRTIEHDRIFGYKALCSQWTYETFLGHVLPEDRAEVDRKFQTALREHGNWDFECRILRSDGEQRWIWACGRHSQDAQGRHSRLAGIVQDITARKQAEEVLRKTERLNEFLADILKNASQPFAVGYPDGRLGLMNPAFEHLTGYDADELRATDWANTLTPVEWTETERRELDNLHRSGLPVRYQKEYLRKDGTRVPIELLVHLVRNAEGAPDYYYSFLTDITERKRAEAALQRAHDELEVRVQERTAELRQVNLELMRRIDENAQTLEALRKSRQSLAEAQHIGHMGSWDWNFDTGELIWSDELFRIFGLAPQELPLELERVMERVHPEDREGLKERVEQALQGGEKYNTQYRIVVPGAGDRTLRAQGEVEFGAQGKPVRMFGTVMDVTEQVRAQQEARLREQQLVQADKMVSLGILTSGVAHEINNPNHSIMTNVMALAGVWEDARPILERFYGDFGDFVLGGFDYSECRDKLQAMYANALAGSQRIELIVNELRGFARNSPGERMADMDVNAVVNSAGILMSSLVKKHTDRFSVDLAEDLPAVTGNFQRIEQVVINLIQNACQSLPGRDRAVTVVTRHDRPSGLVLVEVHDEGTGIAEENIKQMGTPFYTTKLGSEGMGLGLWISSNIAHEHGGTLTFTSKPGEGTLAVLSLPEKG